LRNLYAALGLRLEASDDEIKAAFRKLAKQYHPDLNAGDKRAEERFKEVNEAHAILSDPGARARYDASLSQRSLLRWQRSRSAAAIMAASFALTVTVTFSTAILLQRYGGGLSRFSARWQASESPPAPRRRGVAISEAVDRQRAVALPRTERAAETEAASPGQLVEGPLARPQSPELTGATPVGPNLGSDARVPETDRAAVSPVEVQQEPEPRVRSRLPLPDAGKSSEMKTPPIEPSSQEVNDRAMARQFRTDRASWVSYRNPRFGFALGYPADIFVHEPAQSDELVKHFRSRDGRATLRIVATSNVASMTLAKYRMALIQERYGKAKFDYAPQRDTWFVLSGVAGDDIFYERVTFACDRRSFHGWMLLFPSSERLLYEPIIEEMHRNYRHSNGPGARCGASKPQVSVGTKSSDGATDGSL
jgi:curved DNA-binding protein CbpA